jgi:hypothetical protein
VAFMSAATGCLEGTAGVSRMVSDLGTVQLVSQGRTARSGRVGVSRGCQATQLRPPRRELVPTWSMQVISAGQCPAVGRLGRARPVTLLYSCAVRTRRTVVIACLQSTPRLSATIAHLGLPTQYVGQDRSASDPVVVNLGGQQPQIDLASSSRSQVPVRTASAAACLAWDRPSRGCPLASTFGGGDLSLAS